MNAGTDEPSRAANPHLQEVIRSAHLELVELLRRRAEVMKRIGTVKQTLSGLANIFGDSVLSEELLEVLHRRGSKRRSGFTRACREVLMNSVEPLGARQICDHLRNRFPHLLEHHKDPIATTTTILNRLVAYSEARCFRSPTGRRVWEWVAEDEEDAAVTEILENA